MPDFTQMKTFVMTSDLGSLAAAGRQLGISSAAVSKQITRLEEELRVQLLVRTTRHIELTDVGREYCLQCKRVLEEVEAAEHLISDTKAIPQGILKVVCARQFGEQHLIPHLSSFLDQYPLIAINLELAERIPDIAEEGIDILMGMSIPAQGEIIQKRIATARYVLCASKTYLKKYGTPTKPNDLKNCRYITHSMRKPDNELIFKNMEPVILTPLIRVNDVATMIRLALDGMGIINVHDYAVKEYVDNKELIPLLDDYNQGAIPLYVAFPHRRFLSPKIRCFLDYFEKRIMNQSRYTARG